MIPAAVLRPPSFSNRRLLWAGESQADYPQTRITLTNLADVYAKQGKLKVAEQLLREVAASMTARKQADGIVYALLMIRLAQNLVDQQKFVEAESVARASANYFDKQTPHGLFWFRTQTPDRCISFGAKEIRAGRAASSGGLSGDERAEAALPRESRVIKQALEQICNLYTAWNKPEQARQWCTKLTSSTDKSK